MVWVTEPLLINVDQPLYWRVCEVQDTFCHPLLTLVPLGQMACLGTHTWIDKIGLVCGDTNLNSMSLVSNVVYICQPPLRVSSRYVVCRYTDLKSMSRVSNVVYIRQPPLRVSSSFDILGLRPLCFGRT